MDTLLKIGPLTDDKVMDFIEANITDFRSYTEKDKESIYAQVPTVPETKAISAKTFDDYGLRGTPSAILIDKNGILRQTFFGSNGYLEGEVKQLLNE